MHRDKGFLLIVLAVFLSLMFMNTFHEDSVYGMYQNTFVRILTTIAIVVLLVIGVKLIKKQ